MRAVTDPTRPHCLKCRRSFKPSGGVARPRWACSRCGARTAPALSHSQRPPYTPAGRPVLYDLPVEIVARPVSLCCRREMWHQGRRLCGRVLVRWTCPGCRAGCAVVSHAGRSAPYAHRRPQAARLPHHRVMTVTTEPGGQRPNCPIHDRPMRSNGSGIRGRARWRCELAHEDRFAGQRPNCPKCGRPKASKWRRAAPRTGHSWICLPCQRAGVPPPGGPVVLDARTLLATEPAVMLDLITDQLPTYLTPDSREDARQEIALAIIEGRDLDRRSIRRISAASLGATQSRYSRTFSLDAPILGTDGLTRAELLIG